MRMCWRYCPERAGVPLLAAATVVAGLAIFPAPAAAQEEAVRSALVGGLTLKELDETRERPLFTPSRHPPLPPPPPPPKVKAEKPPKPPPPPPEPPSLRLVGVVMTDEAKLALLLDKERVVKRVALGDKIDGWSVVKLEPDVVELRLKGERSVYRMFKPEAEGGGTDIEDGNNKRKRKRKRRGRRR